MPLHRNARFGIVYGVSEETLQRIERRGLVRSSLVSGFRVEGFAVLPCRLYGSESIWFERLQRIGRSTALSQASRPSGESPTALLRPSGGRRSSLVSLKMPKKRSRKADLLAEYCPPRRPLSNRLQCGSAIVLHEANSPAVSVDECRSWTDRRAWLDQDCGHPQHAPSHPKPRVAPELVPHRAAPVAHLGASEFSESTPAG